MNQRYYLARMREHQAQLRADLAELERTSDPIARRLLLGGIEHEREQVRLYAGIARAKTVPFPMTEFPARPGE